MRIDFQDPDIPPPPRLPLRHFPRHFPPYISPKTYPPDIFPKTFPPDISPKDIPSISQIYPYDYINYQIDVTL